MSSRLTGRIFFPLQVGGLSCLETKLLETSSLMELTQVAQLDLHPAVTLLRNLALGSCKLSEIVAQRAALAAENEVPNPPHLPECKGLLLPCR